MNLENENEPEPEPEHDNKNTNKVKFTPGECIKYTIFLIIFTLVCMLGRSIGENNYYVSDSLSKTLIFQDISHDNMISQGEKDFFAISMIEDIWVYGEQILLPVLLKKSYVGEQNILLGGIRFRQIKVKEADCPIPVKEIPKCYPKLDSSNELKDNLTEFTPPIRWNTWEDNHEQFSWVGLINSYDGSGYVIDLSNNYSEAQVQLADLKQKNFIDISTRILFIDFNLYNPNFNLHTTGRLSFEMPATGGVYTHKEIKTWRLLRYKNSRGTGLAILEIFCLLFIILFTVEEFLEFRSGCNEGNTFCSKLRYGWKKYISNKWHYIDIVNLIFFYGTIILRFYSISFNSDKNLISINKYQSLRYHQHLLLLEINLQMINGFLLWIKMFKYLTFNKRIRFLFGMFERTALDIIIFTIALFVFILAFATTAYLSFSSDVKDFRSFSSSILSLIRFTVSDMDMSELSNSSLIVGPIFYCFWTVLMLLILTNVFIAILSNAYENFNESNKDNQLNLSEFDIFNKVSHGVSNIRNYFKTFDKNNDNKINTSELATMTGIDKKDAAKLIKIYDKDGDGNLDRMEMHELERSVTELNNNNVNVNLNRSKTI